MLAKSPCGDAGENRAIHIYHIFIRIFLRALQVHIIENFNYYYDSFIISRTNRKLKANSFMKFSLILNNKTHYILYV